MDHCPNHCTNVFWTEKSFMYKSRPGIHHQNASNMVCLRYEPLDKNTFLSHGIVDLNKDTIVSQKNGDFKNWHNDEEYLFIPQLDLLVNPCMVSNQNPHNPDTMRILSFWGEQLFFNKQYNLDYYIINKKDIHLTEDARFVLASESGRLFKKYHIQKPSTWIQPGGKTLKFAAQEIKETFGDRKHYLCAGSDGGLQCYNDGNAYARFAMQWGDFSGGINFSADKNQIANQMAKHYFLIGGNHLWDLPIPLNTYLSNLDSLLKWCKRKNIPVKTYREWAKLLYDTPQNPYTNIFPDLKTDLDENGVPDGYDLKEGKLDKTDGPEKNSYSLSIKKKGIICEVKGLAGIEKGENEISLWTKGSPGNNVTITIQMQESQNIFTYTFPAESNMWKKYDLSQSLDNKKKFSMPTTYSYAHVTISCSQYNGGTVKIGGIRWNKKLTEPLYVISKPDTFVFLNKEYAYQLITAQYNIEEKLSFQLVNAPQWLSISSTGKISGTPVYFDEKLPVNVQVKDESGNIAKQSFLLQFKSTISKTKFYLILILVFLSRII
jgi:hypothetical protein